MTTSQVSNIDSLIGRSNRKNRSNKGQVKLPIYLYFSLSLLWLYSGFVPVFFAKQDSLDMLIALGLPEPLLMPIFIVASLVDIVFGLLILSRYRENHLLWLAQFCMVMGYSLIVAIGLPEFWIHPFAPLIKNLPIMALLLYLYQIHNVNTQAT